MWFVEEVHGEGQVRWLVSQAHAIVQELDGDTWIDEMNHLVNIKYKYKQETYLMPSNQLPTSPSPF